MGDSGKKPLRVTTIGDGAMATVCSLIVAGKRGAGGLGESGAPVEVRMWVRDPKHLSEMEAARENVRYLPGVGLPENLKLTGEGAEAFDGADLIIAAVPTQYIRGTLSRLAKHAPAEGGGVPVVSVAKGIEIETLKRPSEVIAEILGERPIAALSGPSIAGELARRLPATMVVAAEKQEAGSKKQEGSGGELETGNSKLETDFVKWVQELFTTPYLRVYRNDDLLGVELAGALKNVIAVAAGILDGMRAGNNAKAALLTRGLVEITRLGVALGAQAETFAGLAGMGDLVTTCVSPEGRNRSFGERVGRGEKPEAVLADMVGVVEGVPTCKAVVALARSKGIAMPISEGLHGVLFEGRNPKQELAGLMARELKSE